MTKSSERVTEAESVVQHMPPDASSVIAAVNAINSSQLTRIIPGSADVVPSGRTNKPGKQPQAAMSE